MTGYALGFAVAIIFLIFFMWAELNVRISEVKE